MTPQIFVKSFPSHLPLLGFLLEAHPDVDSSVAIVGDALVFHQGGWERKVTIGSQGSEVGGLIELADNNPFVCASTVTVPSPLATLSLIALGPLFRAGLVVEPPIIHTNATGEFGDVGESLGWSDDVDLVVENQDMGRVLALTAMAVIPTPDDWADIDALYSESYGRSFYVRQARDEEWNVAFVSGTPGAIYRLRYTPDEPNSLLTIQVMADLDGKCGSAQLVHTMNVMAGFEECLGIPELLPV